MWELQAIPGFKEAIDSERIERSAAFAEIQEEIFGIRVKALTPFLIEQLSFNADSFYDEGTGTEEDVRDFLELVAVEKPDFTNANYPALATAIEKYLERAFLDAPSAGKPSRPHYAVSADLVIAMHSTMAWPMEKTMHTDVRIIYQLIKCALKTKGATIINRRSDAVAGRWLRDDTQVITAPTREKLHAIVNEMREEWQPWSEMSPNMKVTKTSDGQEMISASEAVSWSITVAKRRKAVSDGAQ